MFGKLSLSNSISLGFDAITEMERKMGENMYCAEKEKMMENDCA